MVCLRPQSRPCHTQRNSRAIGSGAVGPLFGCPLISNERDPSRRVHFRLSRRDKWTHRGKHLATYRERVPSRPGHAREDRGERQFLRAFLDETTCPVPASARRRRVGQLIWWVSYLVRESVPTHRPISFRRTFFELFPMKQRVPSRRSRPWTQSNDPVPSGDRRWVAGALRLAEALVLVVSAWSTFRRLFCSNGPGLARGSRR